MFARLRHHVIRRNFERLGEPFRDLHPHLDRNRRPRGELLQRYREAVAADDGGVNPVRELAKLIQGGGERDCCGERARRPIAS